MGDGFAKSIERSGCSSSSLRWLLLASLLGEVVLVVVGCFCVFDRLTSAAFPYPTFPPFCSFSSSAPSSQPGRTTDRGNVRRNHFPLTWHHFRARFVLFFPGSLKFASHTTLYPTFIFMNPEITSFRTGKNLVIDDETRKRRGSTAAMQRNLGDGKLCHRVPGSVFGNFSVVVLACSDGEFRFWGLVRVFGGAAVYANVIRQGALWHAAKCAKNLESHHQTR